MCGLVGVAGDLSTKDEALMKRLLMIDSIRGLDSTGLGVVRNNGDVKVAKTSSHPFALFDMLSFRDALNGNQSTVFLGHNRAATRGVINTANAHPFFTGDILGAHNGTIDWSCHKDLEKELGVETGVDSLALIACIDKIGVKETMKMVRGAWSLTWVDFKEGTLNFLRNKERPMWFAHTKDFKRIIWASEWKMIDAAIHLGGYNEPLWLDKDGHGYFHTEIDTLYSWKLSDLRNANGKKPKPKVAKIEGARPLASSTSSKGNVTTTMGDPFKRDEDLMREFDKRMEEARSRRKERMNRGETTHSTTHSHRGTNAPGSIPAVVLLEGSKAFPYSPSVNPMVFNQILMENDMGCSFCKKPIKWGDKGIAIFTRDKKILCARHSGSDGEKNRIFVPTVA